MMSQSKGYSIFAHLAEKKNLSSIYIIILYLVYCAVNNEIIFIVIVPLEQNLNRRAHKTL